MLNPLLLLVVFASITVTASSPNLAAHGLTQEPAIFSKQSFDFIIVGGGTAGLTVATRLAQDANLNIGVLEAGEFIPPNENRLIDIPALTGNSFTNSELAWQFNTVPQANLNDRLIFFPRGKMLGGSSGLNSMAWVRPRKEELDVWARFGIRGGWNWDGLLPYMMKSANVSVGNSTAFPNSTHHSGFDSSIEGRSGPIQVGYDNTFSGVQSPWVESFIKVGSILNQNPDNGNNIGVFNGAHTVDDRTGNRSYATTGYLIPNLKRQNILVLTGAMVSQVTFSKKTAPLTASGVRYIVNGTTYTATASREVIVSAGTIQTPQILELSGIGNKTLLNKLGIQTLLDIPTVGENFQDHNSAPSSYLLKDPAPITLDALQNNQTFAIEQTKQYLVNHTGLFTTLPTYSYHSLQSFFNAAEVAELVNQTALEIASKNLSIFQKLQAKIQLEWITEGVVGQIELAMFPGGVPGLPNPTIPGKSYFSVFAFGQHLFSRGSVHINSTSVLDAPVIDPNYFDYTFDRRVLSLGLEVAGRTAAVSPLAELIDSVSNPQNITSESDMDSWITQTLGTEYNTIGTAAMAPQDMGGVVGDDLIVYGTSNLRVIDASIIPLHLATHLQQIVYAIGEKAAVIIQESL